MVRVTAEKMLGTVGRQTFFFFFLFFFVFFVCVIANIGNIKQSSMVNLGSLDQHLKDKVAIWPWRRRFIKC